MTLQFDDFNKNILASCGNSLLDFGCGQGRYFPWQQKYLDKIHSYIGVDIDPEVIKKAILQYRNHPNFTTDTFHHIDGNNLSLFEDKSFDTTILVEVIEHIANLQSLETLLKECIRVTKKNIMLTTPNCSDEEFLRKHRLIYDHYVHSVGQGYTFKNDSSHYHHLRFTKESLSQVISKITPNFEILEKKPIEIITAKKCYYKLWAEIVI